MKYKKTVLRIDLRYTISLAYGCKSQNQGIHANPKHPSQLFLTSIYSFDREPFLALSTNLQKMDTKELWVCEGVVVMQRILC